MGRTQSVSPSFPLGVRISLELANEVVKYNGENPSQPILWSDCMRRGVRMILDERTNPEAWRKNIPIQVRQQYALMEIRLEELEKENERLKSCVETTRSEYHDYRNSIENSEPSREVRSA